MREKIVNFFCLMCVIILTLSVISCSSPAQKDETNTANQGSASEKLVIKGLLDKEVSIGTDELKTMQQVEKKVTAVDSAGKKTDYTVKGPLFDDVLKKYGKSQKELKGIRLVAGDGYSIEVPADVLKNRDIILALVVDGKELDSRSKPMRAVVPDERAMYWVKNLTAIEVLENVEKAEAKRVIFIDTVPSSVPVQEYNYYESKDKAFKTCDLLNKFKGNLDSDFLFIKSTDKLMKNETKDNFLKGYIKFTGTDSPAFVSDVLPVGMQVKNVLWFSYGEDVYFSAAGSLTYFEKISLDGKDGVKLSDITKEAGTSSSAKYVLTGVDGYTSEIESKDLENGLIYNDEKDGVSIYFKDLPKNTNIKGLLSISAKD